MRMPKSLLELTVECLHEKFNQFDRNQLERILPPLKRIRKMTLEKFLQAKHDSCGVETRCNERFFAAMPLLINSQKQMMTEGFRNCKQIICKGSNLSVATFHKFIRSLPLNLGILHVACLVEWKLHVGAKEVDYITKMEGLQEIVLSGFAISMAGVVKILRQCKDLHFFEAQNVLLKNDGLPSSVLNNPCNSFVENLFDGTHLRHRVVRLKMSNNKVPEMIRKRIDQPRYVKLILKPKSIAELNMVKNLQPHVTQFYMNCVDLEDGEALKQFPYFPKVMGAAINNPSFSRVKHTNKRQLDAYFNVSKSFFVQNGRTLVFLNVNYLDRGRLTLEQFFAWCPNLKWLIFSNSTVTGKNVPIKHLRSLQQVVWIWDGKECKAPIPLGCILSAPSLESIVIGENNTRCNIDFGDVNALVARIARREILQNLKYCYFNETYIGRGEFANEVDFYARLIQEVFARIDRQKSDEMKEFIEEAGFSEEFFDEY